MTERWIAAPQAVGLLERFGSRRSLSAQRALCARAHIGLVRSRATLFIQDQARNEHAELPPEFWWAEGHEALEQDWATGDFSTWIRQTYHWRAFGVAFELNGLLDMLPTEQKAAASRSLSVAADPRWITASAAVRHWYAANNSRPIDPRPLIIDQCRMGFIATRAQLVESGSLSSSTQWRVQAREWDVPSEFWAQLWGTGSAWCDWDRGLFTSEVNVGWSAAIRAVGMHFLRDDVVAAFGEVPAATGQQVDSSARKNKGGAPPYKHWDEVLCAVWGRIHRGDLQPASINEVARAILEAVEARGDSMSDSTAKTRARLVLAEYNRAFEEGDNLAN